MSQDKKTHKVRFHQYKNGVYNPIEKEIEGELSEVIKVASEMLKEIGAKSLKIFDELGALLHQITDRENDGYAYP
jgi:hypothetical protein